MGIDFSQKPPPADRIIDGGIQGDTRIPGQDYTPNAARALVAGYCSKTGKGSFDSLSPVQQGEVLREISAARAELGLPGVVKTPE